MYPSVPEEPLNDVGHWPQGIANLGCEFCIECGKGYTHWRSIIGEESSSSAPDYPHIAYECGAIWRKVYDHWEGFCGKPKTVQLELQFTEENL